MRRVFTIFSTTCLFLSAWRIDAEVSSVDDLITLANKRFTTFDSEDQRKIFTVFFQNVQEGRATNLNPDAGKSIDSGNARRPIPPVDADKWGEERVIKAEWIRWLCSDTKASSKVPEGGIDIEGARVEGKLDLAWTKIEFPIRVVSCRFKDDITLNCATIPGLELQSTWIKNLDGDSLTVTDGILLADGFRADGRVWLRNAIVKGSLVCDDGQFINPHDIAINLEGAQLKSLFMRDGFIAEGKVDLHGAIISAVVDCDGGRFISPFIGQTDPPQKESVALDLEGAQMGLASFSKGFVAEGQVNLGYTIINGILDCDGGSFSDKDGTALNLQGAKTASILLRFVKAYGDVSMLYATIGGFLDCSGATFINPGGTALKLEGAKTGSVFLWNGFSAQGKVSLLDARIDGQLDCSGGHFLNPGGCAIYATQAHISDSVFVDWSDDGGKKSYFEADGEVSFADTEIGRSVVLRKAHWHDGASLNLTSTKAKTLLNEKEAWPAQDYLLINAFTFDELDKQDPSELAVQKTWIHLQSRNQFAAQPFEQMAIVLRHMGLPDEAAKVLVDKNERYGAYVIDDDRHNGDEMKTLRDVFWYQCLGRLIGFGYYPWNAFYASLIVIAVGAILFKIGYHVMIIIPTNKDASYDGTNKVRDTYPRFNSLVYSLEAFVPLIKLHVEDYWIPNANKGPVLIRFDAFPLLAWGGVLRLYLWIHISLGWVLTTLWVGGLTGILKT